MRLHQLIPDTALDDVDIPVITDRPQCQGDLLILPARPSAKPGQPIPPEGVPVVRGENGGHTHLLVGTGTWAAATGDNQTLGQLTVPAGGEAWLLHPEHGGNAMGPGTYLVRRQREQADEIRLVSD